MHTPTLPVDFLVSYHYFQRDTDMSTRAQPYLRLIADSGAFSAYTQGARIDLDAYAAWIKRWQGHLYWAAALDVFGDPATTYRNWAYLRDDHGLETVPTIHIGDHPQHLDAYAAEGVDFVGLGGMVGMPKPNVLRWLVHVMRYARDHHPQMRFHAWGMSSHSVLEKLPLYSVDSSGPLSYIHRYALLFLYSTRTLTVLSTQRRAQHLQRLHQVDPPWWGINPRIRPLRGPRIHLVQRDPRSLQHLNPIQGAA